MSAMETEYYRAVCAFILKNSVRWNVGKRGATEFDGAPMLTFTFENR
jgi:hypothetical protein